MTSITHRKQPVQLRALRRPRKRRERALLRDLLGRSHEPRPRAAGQGAADADAADAEVGQALHGHRGLHGQHVDRQRMHGFHHRGDLFRRADARRVEAVGAGFGEGDEARDGLGEVALAPQEAFAARHQHDRGIDGVDRRARRRDAFDREVVFVQRLIGAAGGVLDGQAGNAGADGAGDIERDAFGIVGEAGLEVGVDRQVGGRGQHGQVVDHVVCRDAVVGAAGGPGIARRGRGQRLEAGMLKIARGAGVPRVGDHEAAGLMELAECGALLGGGDGHGRSPLRFS